MPEEQGVIDSRQRVRDAQAELLKLPGGERAIQDEVTYRFNSYSGCDIYAIANVFDASATENEKYKQLILGNIQTLTFSTHREKFPARALGHVGARGYTRGPRTIGGTMIFTVFDKAVLSELIQLDNMVEVSSTDSGRGKEAGITNIVLLDQIPPFDISILFANETGSISRMAIYGAELVNEGQTMSVEDLVTEAVVSYVARHIDPMTSLLEPGERIHLGAQGEGPIYAFKDDSLRPMTSWKAVVQDTQIKAALNNMR